MDVSQSLTGSHPQRRISTARTSPLLDLGAGEQVVLQGGNACSTARGTQAPSSAVLYEQVPFLILFHHNIQVMLMTQRETHIALNHLNSLPYTKEHYIHIEHVHISPLASSTSLSKLLQTISSIVQVQDTSSDRRQGTILGRTWG